jgi:hypothetical protein
VQITRVVSVVRDDVELDRRGVRREQQQRLLGRRELGVVGEQQGGRFAPLGSEAVSGDRDAADEVRPAVPATRAHLEQQVRAEPTARLPRSSAR